MTSPDSHTRPDPRKSQDRRVSRVFRPISHAKTRREDCKKKAKVDPNSWNSWNSQRLCLALQVTSPSLARLRERYRLPEQAFSRRVRAFLARALVSSSIWPTRTDGAFGGGGSSGIGIKQKKKERYQSWVPSLATPRISYHYQGNWFPLAAGAEPCRRVEYVLSTRLSKSFAYCLISCKEDDGIPLRAHASPRIWFPIVRVLWWSVPTASHLTYWRAESCRSPVTDLN